MKALDRCSRKGESFLTSLKPTVKMVITVPQDPDEDHHQENSWSPHPKFILQ
jgi:hypothetical protein